MPKRKPIPKALRVAVWNKYYQCKDNALCYVGCGEHISSFNFDCVCLIS